MPWGHGTYYRLPGLLLLLLIVLSSISMTLKSLQFTYPPLSGLGIISTKGGAERQKH